MLRKADLVQRHTCDPARPRRFKAITRHDAKQTTKAERLLFKCLSHAGIPIESVEDVILRRLHFCRDLSIPDSTTVPITLRTSRPARLACSDCVS